MKLKIINIFNYLIAFLVFGISIASAKSIENMNENGQAIYRAHLMPHDLKRYQDSVEGYNIFDTSKWKDMNLTRMDLEVLIFHVAPILGGCDCQIEVKEYSVDTPHSRSIDEVRQGREIAHPIGVFAGDSRVAEEVYLSRPILDADDFFVGLYTHIGRKDVLAYDENPDFHDLVFVAANTWEIDNKVIDASGAKHVLSDNWNSALNMIIAGRADFVMQPFQPTDDLSFVDNVISEKFVPIANVKMSFPEDRVYFVSQDFPNSKRFLHSLNKGIEILDGDDQFLRRAHIWAGVVNPKTDGFREVFPSLALQD